MTDQAAEIFYVRSFDSTLVLEICCFVDVPLPLLVIYEDRPLMVVMDLPVSLYGKVSLHPLVCHGRLLEDRCAVGGISDHMDFRGRCCTGGIHQAAEQDCGNHEPEQSGTVYRLLLMVSSQERRR